MVYACTANRTRICCVHLHQGTGAGWCSYTGTGWCSYTGAGWCSYVHPAIPFTHLMGGIANLFELGCYAGHVPWYGCVSRHWIVRVDGCWVVISIINVHWKSARLQRATRPSMCDARRRGCGQLSAYTGNADCNLARSVCCWIEVLGGWVVVVGFGESEAVSAGFNIYYVFMFSLLRVL